MTDIAPTFFTLHLWVNWQRNPCQSSI